MRKLVYNCYLKGLKRKVVNTLKEANEWKGQDAHHTVKEKLIEWTDKTETEKERDERLARIARKNEAIKRKKANK